MVTPRHRALHEHRNFLLLQYQLALGTAIHATPLVTALHAAIPGARVSAAASGFALEILSNNPGIERLVATPNPLKDLRGAIGALRSAKLFRGEPYAVLQSTGNERSRISTAAMLSGGNTRVGFTVVPQLSAAPLVFDHRLSQIANNLRLVEALGHGPELIAVLEADPEIMEPRVYPTEAHFATAQALLAEQGIVPIRPIAVFITQTNPAQRKSWRPERFRAVAETLRRDYGMQIVFVGTASESGAIESLRSALSFPTATIAGRTGLLDLAALMSLADVAVTLDTGPLHLLRAVRLPAVVIAPAWSPPIEWLPLNNPRARILKNLDMPEATEDYIIDEVTVHEVEQNLHDLLALYPPRTFIWRA
jgi:ADP-heptose:LPS heptosyltransferase